jgi:hypothetical protein
MIRALPRETPPAIELPHDRDPRLARGATMRRRLLGEISAAQRAKLVLERYPELHGLPNCDWQRLKLRTVFSILYGASSRHFAKLELAAMHGILASGSITASHAMNVDTCVRRVLDRLHDQLGITTPRGMTLPLWEEWGRDTELMRALTGMLNVYASTANHHLLEYRERLSAEDQERVGHLLLPPLPHQFRHRFLPLQEQRILTQRRRKSKTDVLSQCATAILALMQARQASAHRFIQWYREQLARVEAGELTIPAGLQYEDQEMDLPRRPGPDTVSIEDLHWRTTPVRLDVTIWRPYEFGTQRFAAWIEGMPRADRGA